MVSKKCLKGHDNAWRAEATLKAVTFMQGLLKGRKIPWFPDRLNGVQRMAFHLDRKNQTGASGVAIDPHRACSADAMLATDMGSRELALIAQGI